MSLTIFPAAPGTYIVERTPDGRTEKTPVVGFNHIQGGIVFPLCAMNHGGLTLGRALLTPDGYVTDAAAGLVCESLAGWEKIASSEGYKRATPKKSTMTGAEEAYAAEAAAADHAERPELEITGLSKEGFYEAKTVTEPKRIPDKPKGKAQVFQTTSFWHDKEGRGAIFKVEGGVAAPAKNDARFEKIKRDDWQTMKKAGAPVIEWPLSGAKTDTSDIDDLI